MDACDSWDHYIIGFFDIVVVYLLVSEVYNGPSM